MAAARRSNRSTSAANKNMRDSSDESDGWEDTDDDQPKVATTGSKRKAPRAERNTDGNPAPARKRQKGAAARADLHDLTLLEIVMKHSNSIDNAVKEWIERYRSNRAAAAAELMTLLVKVGGCDADLTEEDVEAGEVDQLAARLTNTVVQDGGVDVLHNNRTGRLLADHYRVFWDKALRQLAAADLLFDDFELNDKLCRLVTALSISVVRGFRYAATLTAAQLISSWITLSAGLTESRELAKFQLDAEEKKKKPSREVIASLKRTVERCHTRVEDLRNFRSVTFTGVFSHRFRDVSDEIRGIVIESIGSWVMALPTEFLADTYLKYLAWALSDRSALVRAKALAALDGLYSNSDNIPRLHDFTNRFTSRFTELMYDVDEGVAAAGLHLLAKLVEHRVIKEKDVSGVYGMLTLSNASLRNAAAGLVVQLLPEQGKDAVKHAQQQLQADAAAIDTSQQGGKPLRGTKSKVSKSRAGQGAAATVAGAAAVAAILGDSNQLIVAGLLAVMAKIVLNKPMGGDMASADRHAGILASQNGTAGSTGSSLPVLPAATVWNLIDSLWDQLSDVLGDISSLTGQLADEGALELRGRLGNAHLAAVMAAAVKRSIHNTGAIAGRKGRFGRPKAAAAGPGIDEEAQQEATVVLMQKLPALLTQFQSEPHVIGPLLAIPRLLRVELFSLKGQSDAYRALLQQIDGLLHRHSLQELMSEAAATLAFASKEGPAALQEIGMQVLHTSSSTSATQLAAAAAAVARLKPSQLSEGVADLALNPADAPDALLSLLTSLRRCHALMAAGAEELAKDKQLAKACQTLLQQSLEGRELGAEITSLLLQVTNMSLLWQQISVLQNPSGLSSYIQNRSAFIRVCEALMDSMGSELLTSPHQLLKGWFNASESQDIPDDLADQVSAGILTVQDQAAQLLMDLMFVGGGLVAALQDDHNAAGLLDKVAPSKGLMERCWRYCQGVLAREAPDPEALENGDDAGDDIDDRETEGWDVEDVAARRELLKEAKHEAVAAAAASLVQLKQSVVVALSKLALYKAVPEPQLSWLLAKLVTLLDGQEAQVTALIRAVLQQLKSSSADALPTICMAALTDMFESAEEAGHEENTDTWHHLAGVANKIAGLYIGHNLSQGPLHSLISNGLSWVLEAPSSRAAFLTACLTPFTAKLAPQEAERVAGEVKSQLSDGSSLMNAISDDDDTLQAFNTYCKALEDRAAGKKPARGVLKTPARTAAAAEPEDEIEDDDQPVTGAGGKGSRKRARGSRIKFANEVELSPDAEPAAAEGGSIRKPEAPRSRQQQSGSSKKRARRQQQDESDDGWEDSDEQQQQPSESSSGWHAKRSGTAAAAQGKQQSRRGRQQQRQEEEAQHEHYISEEDEEPQQQQQQLSQQKSPTAAGRTRGRQPTASPATAVAPKAPQQAARSPRSAKAALRMFAGEAGPMTETQSQSLKHGSESQRPGGRSQGMASQSQKLGNQSQSQQPAAGAAAAAGRRGRSAASQSLRAESEQDDEQQQQGDDIDLDMVNGGVADAADIDLGAATDDEEGGDAEYDQADPDDGDIVLNLGLGHDPAESEDHAGESDEDQGDGGLSQYSEPLSNVQIVLDDITELGEEVDEPPPQARRNRRRR